MNLTRKIIEKHLVSGRMTAGEEIAIRIDQTLTQDSTGTMAYLQLEALGIDKYAIRKLNVLRKGDIDGHGQLVYNNGSDEAITAAANFIEWDKPAHAPEGPWRYGKGLSLGNKFTAYGKT